MNCIFCDIIDKKISSYTIYEDDIVKCFLDVNPESNGHTLIVPKKHYVDLSDIDEETLSHILKIAKKIKKLLEEKLNINGLTLIQNNGLVEEVKHFHLHLKPYYYPEQPIINIEDIYNKLKSE